jgi:DNA-binding response OmpR family regulator
VRKVLVVEADPGMSFVMCETLLEAGFEPVTAGTELAASLAKELGVAGVVASLTTAAYDQSPLFRALKKDPATVNTPLLLCTGRGEGTVRRVLGEKPPYMLFKPFTVDQFAKAVTLAFGEA